jgi:hypothetical protein
MTNDEKIIYVVVAETVQHPLTTTIIGNHLVRLDTTRTIVQIPGRLAAQAHTVRIYVWSKKLLRLRKVKDGTKSNATSDTRCTRKFHRKPALEKR